VESYPPKSTFSEDRILALKGCYIPKFLHLLENDQVLLVHPPMGMGVLLTIFFFKGGPKLH